MATSGSIDYSLNTTQIIDYALHKLRVLGLGETASAEQSTAALRELNVMLKEWQRYENRWRWAEGSATLVADQANYTLSPRPHHVISARYRDSNSNDLPLQLVTREEYYDLPDKTASGSPVQYYVDYLLSSAVLYIWPVPDSVTTETIKYTYLRFFDDADALTNDLDLPAMWLSTVGLNLAARLADDYGREGPRIDRLIARAEGLREQMLDDDRPDEYRFVME